MPARDDEALFDLSVRDDVNAIQCPHPVTSSDSSVAGLLDAGYLAAIDTFLSSPVYKRTRAAAGRAALPDATVRQVLRLLLAGRGRAPSEQVARALGVPVGRLQLPLAVLRRLLNVEGYQVVSLDADGRTVLLDEPLWRTQFGVGDR